MQRRRHDPQPVLIEVLRRFIQIHKVLIKMQKGKTILAMKFSRGAQSYILELVVGLFPRLPMAAGLTQRISRLNCKNTLQNLRNGMKIVQNLPNERNMLRGVVYLHSLAGVISRGLRGWNPPL